MPRPHHNNFNKTSYDIHKDNEFNKKLRSLKNIVHNLISI